MRSQAPVFVTGGWDKVVRVWNLQDCQKLFELTGHSDQVNTVAVSPDCSLCASSGKVRLLVRRDCGLRRRQRVRCGRRRSTLKARCARAVVQG